jgi:succinate dehydrogenase / fumarate reductase cytochrome b subunit
MLVSILHRLTGGGLAIVGAIVLVWWLSAAADGEQAYALFTAWAAWPWALILWVPLSWALFQHALSGLRHFVMDAGAGFELRTNRIGSIATLVGSLALTAALWAYILVPR